MTVARLSAYRVVNLTASGDSIYITQQTKSVQKQPCSSIPRLQAKIQITQHQKVKTATVKTADRVMSYTNKNQIIRLPTIYSNSNCIYISL